MTNHPSSKAPSGLPALFKQVRYPQLLAELERRLTPPFDSEQADFYVLLKQMATHYETTEDWLLQQGFRKAYRQIVEGT